MAVNVLLCRSHDGWHEVLDPDSIDDFGRKEAYLSVGALQSTGEVERVAGVELERFARQQRESQVVHHPLSTAETPFIGYRPGDTITAPGFTGGSETRVVYAVTVNEDVDGQVTYSAELGDNLLGGEFENQIASTIRKMTPGTLAGHSQAATPAAPRFIPTSIQQSDVRPTLPVIGGFYNNATTTVVSGFSAAGALCPVDTIPSYFSGTIVNGALTVPEDGLWDVSWSLAVDLPASPTGSLSAGIGVASSSLVGDSAVVDGFDAGDRFTLGGSGVIAVFDGEQLGVYLSQTTGSTVTILTVYVTATKVAELIG